MGTLRRFGFRSGLLCVATLLAVAAPAAAQDITLTAGSAVVPYDPEFGAAQFAVSITASEEVPPGEDPAEIDAFEFDLAHDGELFAATGFTMGEALQAMNGGGGPFFMYSNPAPVDGSGVICAAIFSAVDPPDVLILDPPTELVSIEYETNPEALLGDVIGTISPLTWSSTLGNPDISSTFVSNFMEVFPTL
ncbi:MAG: hypothetical protein L0Z55_06160, partial [Planctomycetes bacterium]|nr:hypothetical protein [Planctomycetota bacterium]